MTYVSILKLKNMDQTKISVFHETIPYLFMDLVSF